MIRATGMAMREPCPSCPFRTDWDCHLNPGRAEEMVQTLRSGGSIPCWETISDYDENGVPVYSPDEQHCAGALIILERNAHPPKTPWMKWAKKIGIYRPELLNMDAPVFDYFWRFTEAMRDRYTLDRVAERMKPVAYEASTSEDLAA